MPRTDRRSRGLRLNNAPTRPSCLRTWVTGSTPSTSQTTPNEDST